MSMAKNNHRLDLPKEGFARLEQVLFALGIGRTTFLTGVKDGQFPQPVRLTKRSVGWRVEDIRNLINSYNYE